MRARKGVDVFNWFSKGSQGAPDLERLQGITGSPAAVVQQVCDCVAEWQEDNRLTAELLQSADAHVQPVIAELEATRQQQRSAAVRLLRTHAERFARAYAKLLNGLPAGGSDTRTTALRAAYLFGRAIRLARRTLEDPGILRTELIALFGAAHQRAVAIERGTPYPGLPESAVAQEVAQALLWETAPFDALTSDQIEYFERFITFFGNRIIMKVTPGATAPFAVLQDGRVLSLGNETPGQAILFVGPGPLTGLMAGVLKMGSGDPLPVWAGDRLPHTSMPTLQGLAQRLSVTWERKKIARGSERIERNDQVMVTGGFDNLRRAVAYSAYVRSGGKLAAYKTHSHIISDKVREVMVGLEDDRKPHSPLDILEAMESAGDKQAVEPWTAKDSSSTGYSLVVSSVRAWLAVGCLLAVREQDSIDWQVGIVRRIFGPPGMRKIGVEILPGRALPVSIVEGTDISKISLADMIDAILILNDERSLMVTAAPCKRDVSYLLSSSEGRQRFHVDSLYMSNPDYAVNLVVVD